MVGRVTALGRYTAAHVVTWFGGAMTLVALPILVFQRTGSAALTGLLAALEALPYFLFGLFAGALADRWDQGRTMVITAALSGLVMAGVPVAHWFGMLATDHLLAAAIATLFVFYDAASFGALPAIVGRERIGAATGRLSALSTTIDLAGPSAAGLLIAGIGVVNLIALDAASYLLAAGVLATVRWTPVARGPGRATIAEGLAYLWRQPVIRNLTLLGAAHSLAGGAVTGLLVVVGVRRLGLAADDARLGLLYAAAACGALLASLAIAGLQRRYPIGSITLTALTVSGLALTGWAWNGWWLPGLFLLVIWQAGATTVILNAIIVRQTLTPDHLQARVNTTARMIGWGGTPFGALLGGLLAEAAGTHIALSAAAALLGAVAVVVASTSVRRVPTLSDLRAPQTVGTLLQ
ncbi:MFS transporter [Cryptosporangium japonicum]|uniref:MFS transporter n=1 Tax=Cryptosporangium japonicum TaxID=80872 RepID=A0ABN0TGE5_9ACTN